MKFRLAAVPWMALASCALAQPPLPDEPTAAPEPAKPWFFAGYWDNDGGPLKRNHIEDKHYTNGFALVVAHQPGWVRRLNDRLPDGERFDRTAVGYLGGQLMFTPTDLTATTVIEDDRPYAGYLFGGAFLQRANDTTLDHLQLELGVVGPSSQAEDLQDIIHEWTNGVEPQGWGNQLEDEPTIQAYYRRKWRFDVYGEPTERGRPELQVIPQVGVALGTVYRHLEAGATLRLGLKLPDDFGPGRVSDPAAFTRQDGRGGGFYGYVFARAAGRAVEHNLFLEGNTWEDSHSVEEEPLVGELSAGLAVGYRSGRWTGEIVYSQTALTPEFTEQDGGDEYGSLAITITGWF